jgi:cysteine synthase
MPEENGTVRIKVLRSAAEAIGGTPIVELNNITANLSGRILAKLDYLNPAVPKRIASPAK